MMGQPSTQVGWALITAAGLILEGIALFGNQHDTLTKTVRQLFARAPWIRLLGAAVWAWLGYHLLIEGR